MCIELDYYTESCTLQNRIDISDNIAQLELEHLIKSGYKCYKKVKGGLRKTWVNINDLTQVKRLEVYQSWSELVMLDGHKIIIMR